MGLKRKCSSQATLVFLYAFPVTSLATFAAIRSQIYLLQFTLFVCFIFNHFYPSLYNQVVPCPKVQKKGLKTDFYDDSLSLDKWKNKHETDLRILVKADCWYWRELDCCIFRPAFGCCALQTLVEMTIFSIFTHFFLKKARNFQQILAKSRFYIS